MIDWEKSELCFLGSGKDINNAENQPFLVFIDLKQLLYLENGKPLLREPRWIKCYAEELDNDTYNLFIKRAHEKLSFNGEELIKDTKHEFSHTIATIAIIQNLDSKDKEYYTILYKSKTGFSLYNSVEVVPSSVNTGVAKKYAYYILDNKLIDKVEYDKRFIQKLSKINSKLGLIGADTVDFNIDEYGILTAKYLSPYLKEEDTYSIMMHSNMLTSDTFKDCKLTNMSIPNNIWTLILRDSNFTKNLKSLKIDCNKSSNIQIEVESDSIEDVRFGGKPDKLVLTLTNARNLKTLILPTCEKLSVTVQYANNLNKLVIKDNTTLPFSFIFESNIKEVRIGKHVTFIEDEEDGYAPNEALFEGCVIKNLYLNTLTGIPFTRCKIENLYLDRSMKEKNMREFFRCKIDNYIYK